MADTYACWLPLGDPPRGTFDGAVRLAAGWILEHAGVEGVDGYDVTGGSGENEPREGHRAASARSSAAAVNRSASCSRTRACWASTSSREGWAKIDRTSVATSGWADFGTRVSRFRTKWVLHRCQLAPGSTAAIAATNPAAARPRRALPEGPVRHRPGAGHRELPRRDHRPHPCAQRRLEGGALREGLRRLPPALFVHLIAEGPDHHRRSQRGGADPSTGAPARSGGDRSGHIE
jgi:hypothetical protein